MKSVVKHNMLKERETISYSTYRPISEDCMRFRVHLARYLSTLFYFFRTRVVEKSDFTTFDVTTSNVSFLWGSYKGERDVTASPLHDVTRMAYTTPEPHGRTDHRLPSPTAEPDPDYCYMNTCIQCMVPNHNYQ